jgi:hypothetical protein
MSLVTPGKADKQESADIGVLRKLLNKLRGLELRVKHGLVGTRDTD